MTELRKRMIEDLQLRGMGALTQQRYARAVQQLAEHYGKSPDKITEEELRDYFLYLKNVKKWARSTSTIALCGIKFFYEHSIKRDWPVLHLIRAERQKKLPGIHEKSKPLTQVQRSVGKLSFPVDAVLRSRATCQHMERHADLQNLAFR